MTELESIEARMANGKPFTYGELMGLTAGGHDPSRVADRAIQRWRKRGWISYERVGRSVVWTFTDAGRAALASE